MADYKPFTKALNLLALKIGEPDLIEQIKKREASNQAIVFSDVRLGFLALHTTSDNALNVWVGIKQAGISFNDALAFVFSIAQSSSLNRITFKSNRKGFRRLARKHGFIEKAIDGLMITYEKEVTP